ncbi:unnamed protein product [Brassica rapa]|uniref:E3 ubiquitin-protein ligase APD1-4 middle domain-containing protein n=1 Tax=Brassica campestris TaxID=3711 RepID=A0A8D9DI17_BRACM|nr:unnamed protein product [Brassica rapa]
MDFRAQLLGDHPRPRWASSTSDVELKFSYAAMVFFGWINVAMYMLAPVLRPTNVWIGPNASMLVEPNSIFIKSVKVVVENVYGSEPGLQLFGFYASPPVAVMNWSESRLVSVSHRSYGSQGCPYYLNEGASLNISYNVKPEGCSVRLVVDKVIATRWLWEEPPNYETALSLNLIQGYGVIQLNIKNTESYHLNVANPNLKDVEAIITLVELDIDVKAVVYDTKEPPFYKCNFSNRACTFNTMPFVGTSIVITSPAYRQGVLSGEQEWFIRISYQARCTSYAIVTGLVICFILLSIKLNNWLQHHGEERYVMDDDSSIISLLVNKDDDV